MADFGYQARIPVSALPRQVRSTPGAGAAIAAGIGQVAQTVGRAASQQAQVDEQVADSEARIEDIEMNRWRANTGATLLTRYADLQVEADAAIEELRKTTPPGAPEHEDKVRQTLDALAGKFLGEIPKDDELQNRFRPMVANLTARTTLAERGWEQQARAKHQANSWEQWETTAAGRLYAKPSGAAFSDFMAEGQTAIELLDTDETTKAALRTQLQEVGTRSLFTGLIDSGQQAAVRAGIEAGHFDDVLDDKAKSNWLARTAQADRIAQNEADAAASAARRTALEQAKALKVRMENGEDVSAADANSALAAMRQAGVPESDMLEFQFFTENSITAQSLRGYATPELMNRQKALQSTVDAGDATAKDKRELELIQQQLKGRTTREADELGKMWKGTPEQKLEALARARQLPASQRLAATSQVSVSMQLMSSFSPRNQALAVQGSAIRADRPADFLPEAKGRSEGGKDEVQSLMRQYLGETVNDIGGITDDMMNVALDLMAGSRASNKSETGWHKGDFLAALRAVTGGTQRADGTWQGGVGSIEGKRVELPADVSEQEFARRFARFDFPGATYADGRAAQPVDIKKHFRPVFVETDAEGAAVYVLQGKSGLLLKGEQPYRLRVWGNR